VFDQCLVDVPTLFVTFPVHKSLYEQHIGCVCDVAIFNMHFEIINNASSADSFHRSNNVSESIQQVCQV
jgi:hypothetical protein